jgi:hypothetical protein
MGLASELATCPTSKHASPIDHHSVDRPEQRRPHRDRLGQPQLPQRNARFAPTNAMECMVLRVPCIPSSRLRGFWRSSVRSADRQSPNLGRGCRPLSVAGHSPSPGCTRPDIPAAPRRGRAARCAPECAHALNAVARSLPGRRIHRGSALRRRRAAAAPRSVNPVDVIAANQTSETWDE